MASTTIQFNLNPFGGLARLRRRMTARGLWFGLILLAALVAFELFNFATTEFALQTLFGERDALGVATWASVLAVAFCGIDFAGLSRLFTPETGRKEPKEVWLLTGAWFLGASMNAIMTWWAVGSALSANPNLGNDLLTRQDVLLYGPIFIASLVWLTRILIIGTFAFAGDHIFSTADRFSDVVDGLARPAGRDRGRSRNQGGDNWFKRNVSRGLPKRQPRAVPKPSAAPALNSRNEPLVSSSYARAADSNNERRVYGSQRSFFGRGAGDDDHDERPYGSTRAPAASTPTPAYATTSVRETYTSPTQRSLPAAEHRPQPEARPEPRPTPLWSAPQPERPGREEEPPARTQSAYRAEPARAASAGAASPTSTSTSGGRASSVRTVGSAFTRAPRPTATVTDDDPDERGDRYDRRAGAMPPTSNELEYVDLD